MSAKDFTQKNSQVFVEKFSKKKRITQKNYNYDFDPENKRALPRSFSFPMFS